MNLNDNNDESKESLLARLEENQDEAEDVPRSFRSHGRRYFRLPVSFFLYLVFIFPSDLR